MQKKYGGKTLTIHGFETYLPNKIRNLDYNNNWTRTGGNSWQAEALPWRPSNDANTAKEIAFVDTTALHRIGKWSADTATKKIMDDVI